ncbi:MAG TPA: MBL fold metallo-hydrolase [Burkholderiales bacterium]|nr:MBL fold metallo-hydrolase [Burkholderiales bacterium]
MSSRIIAAVILASAAALQGNADAQEIFRVTLLGTGTPTPRLERLGPATLVEAGSEKLLFDAGRGVPIRFEQVRIPVARLDALFITHYHSDHVSGIPDVWLSGWLPGSGGRARPFRVIGPTGAKELMSSLEKAYAADVRIRIADQKLNPAGASIVVDEFASDGVVYERSGVRVTAFEVDHGDAIKPAFGYRIDYRGRSALISGDTRFSENLIRNGMGVDLLVHAIAGAKPELLQDPVIRLILDHHTLPPQAATVFNRTKPRLAVYTHIVQQRTASVSPPTVEEIVADTRKTYSGPLQVGEDLMSFDITEAGVKVNHPPH